MHDDQSQLDEKNPSPIREEEGISHHVLFFLLLSLFIDLFGFGIIIPLIPFLAIDLGISGTTYGLLIATYSFVQFIMSPIWGRLSDSVGRKPIILLGLFGSSIGFSLFAMVTSVWFLFVARAVAGFFTAATLSVSQAYIADVTPPEKRAQSFGLVGVAFGLGFATGPAVGGLLSQVSVFNLSWYATPSFFAAVLALFNFVAALILIPESLLKEERHGMSFSLSFQKQAFNAVLHQKTIVLLIFLFSLVNLSFSGFESIFAYYASYIDSTIKSKEIGIFMAYIGVIVILTQGGLLRVLVKKLGEYYTLITGLLASIIGFAYLSYAQNRTMLFIALLPIALGISLTSPTVSSMLSKQVRKTQQGRVLGINQGVSSLMRVLGPILAGSLFDVYYRVPFYTSSGLFVLVLLIVLISRSLHEQENGSPSSSQATRVISE